MVQILTTPAEFATYDLWVKSHPQGTLWQSLEWKQYQEALGRETRLYVATAAATHESLLRLYAQRI